MSPIIDIEDGFRLGHFSYAEVLELFWPMISDQDRQRPRLEAIGDLKDRVEFLRAKVINEVIRQVVDSFMDCEAEILGGRFDSPLLDALPLREPLDALVENAARRIYCAPEVVSVQAAGFQVISDLLERFSQVVDDVAEHGERASPRSRMLIRLVPQQFIGSGGVPAEDPYRRLLLLTDVAGVLDNNKTLLPELTLGDIDRLTAEGVITGGMIPKLESCASVVRGGVDGVVITDGRVPHCVLLELLTPHGVGTRISERQAKRS
mgnify:CR=1 FL=1